VSWFGWAILFIIATAAQASKGIDWSLAVPLISTISTTIIAFTALHLGRAVWTRADGICIALGILAIVLWAITKEPLTAIILSIIADLAVTMPTIVKTYQDPTSEPATLWVLYVIGAILELVATQQFTVYNLLFPIYTVLGSVIITALALRGRFTSRTV
jgi:CDP-diglyceride synthetase